jgi:hypothetical protein
VLNCVGQAVAGLEYKARLVLQASQKCQKLFTVKGAAGRHHADALGLTQLGGRFQGWLNSDNWKFWKVLSQQLYCGGRCGVAGDDQCLDVVLCHKIPGDGVGAGDDVVVIALSIWRVAAVGHVHKLLQRQLGPKSA